MGFYELTSVTLIANSIQFTFQDGDVKNVETTITSLADNQPITASGPLGAFNTDFSGAQKRIVLRGFLHAAVSTRVAGYSVTSILGQKQWLESLINGQQYTIFFFSNYESSSVTGTSGAVLPQLGQYASTQCYIDSLFFRENEADPLRLEFNISFIVGQPV